MSYFKAKISPDRLAGGLLLIEAKERGKIKDGTRGEGKKRETTHVCIFKMSLEQPMVETNDFKEL